MPYRLGIDLGTTFTAAALYRDRTVQSELVPLGTRSATVPSVLFISGDTTLVGEAAERRALTDPEHVVRDFKRRLGDPTPLVVGGQPHAASELAARLVDWVVDQVTSREGAPPEQIAVTYPAAWGPHRESLLRNALPEVTLLTEPQAAALAYASTERVEVGATIAIYDLGGGTFDAVVVRKTGTGFTLLGTPDGIDRLGGLDIDDLLLDRVLADTPPPTDPVAMARLRRECVEAKEALSVDTEATIPVLAANTQVQLSRAEFEALIRPLIAETVRSLDRAIHSAGLTAADLTTVLLVGGSSRIPLVRAMISAELGCPVAVDADPKGVVAVGAALSIAPARGPLKPVLNSTPPALPRPKARLRRTKVVLGAFVMLLLALAVLPSPFSTKSTPTPEDQPAGAGAPAQPATAGTGTPGSPKKPTARPAGHSENPDPSGQQPPAAPPLDPANPGTPLQQQAAPPTTAAPTIAAPPPGQAPGSGPGPGSGPESGPGPGSEPPPVVAAADEPTGQEPPPPATEPPPPPPPPPTTERPQPATTAEPPPPPPTSAADDPAPANPPSS
jgi:molecular chaperone DnaK